MINVCCIGSGNMGFALMKGIAGVDIYFTDADTQKAQAAADSIGAKALNSNKEAVEKGDFIFLAVKPQIMQDVLTEIAPAAQRRLAGNNPPVFVSMAAGWSIEKIQTAIMSACSQAAGIPVVRTMPNTPALIGKGMIAYAASGEVPAEKAIALEKMLGSAGIVDRVEETCLDAVTGLSGSGPAFVYLFIEALAEGGVSAGMPKEKALRYAAQTVLGAAAMVTETGKKPKELIDMVTSPGGTTLAGLFALNNGAFKETVARAVETAWKRAIELGK